MFHSSKSNKSFGIKEVTLLSLTLPIIFEAVMTRLLGTVNTAILGAYSDDAAGAVGSAGTLINLLFLFFQIISAGASVIISNHIGAKNEDNAKQATYVAIRLCLIIAAILTPILFLLSPRLIGIMNLSGQMYEWALTYLRIQMTFVVCTAMSSMLLGILRCFGYPQYTFLVGIVINLINLALCVLVVFFPELSPIHGVAGIAAASVTATTIGLIIVILCFARLRLGPQKPHGLSSFWHHCRSILYIGVPSGISGLSYHLVQMLTMSFIALLGDLEITARVYFNDILSYAFLIGQGMGTANSIIVGRLFGAGKYDEASRQNIRVLKRTVPVNLSVSLLILLLRKPLLSLFTDNTAILALALGVFAVDIIAEQARAVSHVYEYALKATGDVYLTTAVITVSGFVIGIGLAYFLSITCGMGLIGCYIAVSADEITRAVVSVARWKSGRWRPDRAKKPQKA
ncbi:MAG: MATE family efflux transporter [Clostridia bacterium]|nr:MATE family efflux transporter [Clostridia bacterium]